MPAYVVVQIAVEDPVRYAEYRRIAPPSIAAYGDTVHSEWANVSTRTPGPPGVLQA